MNILRKLNWPGRNDDRRCRYSFYYILLFSRDYETAINYVDHVVVDDC